MADYIFRGDRLKDPNIKGAQCSAIRRPDGKCIRGKNSNMMVQFENGVKVVVLARQLRKIST